MPGFDSLAPDQRAVLQLLLKQGKSYEDIAGLLRLEATSVRERALDALDALGADVPGIAGDLSSERQDELADHLLLQQSASERASTRQFLEGSAPGRAWARGVRAELAPIGGDALPEVPAERAEVAEAFGALDERTAARERHETSSKLGGVLILVAVAAVVGLGLLFLLRRDDDDAAISASAAGTPAATVAGGRCVLPELPATGATGPTGIAGAVAVQGAAKLPQQQVNLEPPEGRTSKALGYAILAEGGLAFQAEGLPASILYKVWIWQSAEEAIPLGFGIYNRPSKRLAGAIPALPAAARNCAQLVVTKQRSSTQLAPGQVVLAGPLKAQ